MSRPSAAEPAAADPFVEFDVADPVQRAAVDGLIAVASRADGQPPFSDQSLLELRSGKRMTLLAVVDGEVRGVGSITRAGVPREAEFVVLPAARGAGLGGRLLDRLLELSDGPLVVWAHGDHPAARALASRRGLVAVRELLQLRLSPVTAPPDGAPTDPFRPGVDDAEWIALNAAAFADHPEQGRLTLADLQARMAEPWFDADDFLLTRGPDGRMTGFCWLKVEGDIGEFYAVGVAPSAQGTGIGRGLVDAGLARLASRGIRTSALYVEGDNAPALHLYRSVGFVDHTVDIQYRGDGPRVERG